MQGHYNGVLQWERESGLSSEESRGEWELRVKETKMVGGGGSPSVDGKSLRGTSRVRGVVAEQI